MLQLKNISVTYNNQTIFEKEDFKANDGSLTLITGESGCGKTTLLRCIGLKGENIQFYWNQQPIEQIELFRQQQMFYGGQDAGCVEYLTIKENIRLIQEIYGIEPDEETVISIMKELNLETVYGCFPRQLSGGELKRFILALAVISDRQILLLDEPTAALDDDMRTVVISLLLKLSKLGKTVIATTPDTELMEQGDTIYQIAGKKLVLQKEDSLEEASLECPKITMPKWKGTELLKGVRYHPVQNTVMLILGAFVISAIIFVWNYDRQYISVRKDLLKGISGRECVIYNPLEENREFGGMGSEFPVDAEILKSIENYPGVQSVKPYYSFDNTFLQDGDYTYGEISNLNAQNEVIASVPSGTTVAYQTYYPEMNYTDFTSQTYGEEGVYITQDLADLLQINEENHTLKFDLYVPTYEMSGGFAGDNNGNRLYYINSNIGEKEQVTLPVAGVLSRYWMGVDVLSAGTKIYLDYDFYQQMINKHKKSDTYTEESKWENGKDFVYSPCRPTTYHVSFRDDLNTEKFLDFLDEQQVGYMNQYFDYESALNEQTHQNHMLKLLVCIIFTAVVIMNWATWFFRRHEERSVYRFTRMACIPNKKVLPLLIQKYTVMAIPGAILSIIFIWIGSLLLTAKTDYSIGIHAYILVPLILLTVLLDIIVPGIIVKGGHHD